MGMIGRFMCIGGAVIAFGALFLDWFGFLGQSATGWQAMRRTDVAITIAMAATVVVAAFSLSDVKNKVATVLIVPFAAAGFGLAMYLPLEGFAEEGAEFGMYVELVGALIAFAGSFLVALAAVGAVPDATPTSPSASTGAAGGTPPAPPTPPPVQ